MPEMLFTVFAAQPANPAKPAAGLHAEKKPGGPQAGNRTSFFETLGNLTRETKNHSGEVPGLPENIQLGTGTGVERCKTSISGISFSEVFQMLLGLQVQEAPLKGTPQAEADPGQGTGSSDSVTELLGQLMEILQALGISADGKSPDPGGPSGDSEFTVDTAPIWQALTNPGISEVDKILTVMRGNGTLPEYNLKHLWPHLLKLLNKIAELSPEISELKALIPARLNENAGLPDKDFLKKLADTVEKIAQSKDVGQIQAAVRGQAALLEQTNLRGQTNFQGGAVVRGETFSEEQGTDIVRPVNTVTGQGPILHGGSRMSNTESRVSEGQDTLPEVNQESAPKTDQPDPPIQNRQEVYAVIKHSASPEPVKSPESPAQFPKTAHEIIGQIVQKAKIISTPGVTKMQIELKPEHLGKLNLSITSENGSVTARFNAESHQVKSVIESNLNVLRDALAEQGVKVDQLIVNLGPDRDYSGFRERGSAFRNNSTKGSRTVLSDDELDGSYYGETDSSAVRAYYGSTVDFIA